MPSRPDDYRRLASLVASGMPLVGLYSGLQAILASRMPARNMFIALIEPPHNLRFPWFADEKIPESPLALYPYEGLTAFLMDRGRRLWKAEEPDFLELTTYVGVAPADWLGIPFRDRRGEVTGAIVVQTYDEGAGYSEEDAEFLEFASLQVSLAVQLHAQDSELAVRRIEELVEQTTELEHLYPGIHAIIAKLIPAARRSFMIARVDPKAGLFRLVYCRDEWEPGRVEPWNLGAGLSGFVYSTSPGFYIYEDGATPLPEGVSAIGDRPAAFWLGAPIRIEGEVTGVVIIQTYDRSEPITREDGLSLQSICPHIGQAIARTELFRHGMD